MTRPLFLTLNFWKHGFSLRVAIESVLAGFGAMWLAVEVTAFFSPEATTRIEGWGFGFFGLGLAYATWRSWPNLTVSHRLAGRDSLIEIKVADIFELKGAMVVSTNTAFESDTDGGRISLTSLQGQFTRRFYDKSDHLAHELATQLQNASSETVELGGEEVQRYPVGTVVMVHPKGQVAYFLALSHLNEFGNAVGTFDDLQRSLPQLWDFVASRGELGTILMPIVGSGLTRLTEPRERIIREIVQSFAAACASTKFCEALTIVVSPSDFRRHQIDLNELGAFVRHTCLYNDVAVTGATPEGTGIA